MRRKTSGILPTRRIRTSGDFASSAQGTFRSVSLELSNTAVENRIGVRVSVFGPGSAASVMACRATCGLAMAGVDTLSHGAVLKEKGKLSARDAATQSNGRRRGVSVMEEKRGCPWVRYCKQRCSQGKLDHYKQGRSPVGRIFCITRGSRGRLHSDRYFESGIHTEIVR